ncbi:hypothetical protein IHQ71_31355 (plasmid) [Rhizobium sp. TH2]|uniref:hypothetical protein n=1 Tax=Rhizobium sp. TH2 TaxID=2775403 RepID=UPI00215821BA|nr:hypothetical protein [Rhizobium sp. TH2]UVC12663.1 hypothetical protein IHQ71_31355 [Rhizobium sp. TH2]
MYIDFNYIETSISNLDMQSAAAAEYHLSQRSYHQHHTSMVDHVKGSIICVIPDDEFEEWAADGDGDAIRESVWKADLEFAETHGLQVKSDHFGQYCAFDVGKVDGHLAVIRFVLKQAGLIPLGEIEFSHQDQLIPQVSNWEELFKVEPIDLNNQYNCGILAGKLLAVDRLGYEVWDLDDLDL